jgi:hypothetical protein
VKHDVPTNRNTAGSANRPPGQAGCPTVGDPSTHQHARHAGNDRQQAESGLARALVEVEVALVVLGKPGGDRRDREQQGCDTNQRVAHGADVHDRPHVVAQADEHVSHEPAHPALEERGAVIGAAGSAALAVASGTGMVDHATGGRHQVGAAPPGLAQPEHQPRHCESGEGGDQQADSPVEGGGQTPADRHAQARARKQHDLLDRERPSPTLRRVVVAEQAGRRGLRDRLPEPQRGTQRHQHRKVQRGGAEGAEGRPPYDRAAHRPAAVPAVRQVARRHRDQAVEQQGEREHDADSQVAHAELVLERRDHAPDDVLVDLVHEQHQAQDPHRL